MSAHHNVHGAIGQPFEGFIHFFGRAKAGDFCHLHRPLRKAVFQSLKVLLSKQRGRCQDGHLFATSDRNECGTQCHFCFAKAHIAAHQSVHGAWTDHVLNDGMNGRVLIGCFAKAKIVGKHFVVLWAVSKGMALAGGAPGINVQQLCS